MSTRLCSDFAARGSTLQVLIIGAERRDEFANAMRLAGRGHRVIVVNPRESIAARQFVSKGGDFIQSAVERLPSTLCCFDLICENYPYTMARVKEVCEEDSCPMWISAVAIRAYAMARLRRLAPTGRWILFTESPGFARALCTMVHRDDGMRRSVSVRLIPLGADAAPPSSYPHLSTRFQLIFHRNPAKPRLKKGVPVQAVFV
jgi:hypothetical protein